MAHRIRGLAWAETSSRSSHVLPLQRTSNCNRQSPNLFVIHCIDPSHIVKPTACGKSVNPCGLLLVESHRSGYSQLLTSRHRTRTRRKKEMGRATCTPENLQSSSSPFFVPGRYLAAPLAGKSNWAAILPASWRSSAIGHVSLWCGAAANHGGPSGLVQRVLDAGP